MDLNNPKTKNNLPSPVEEEKGEKRGVSMEWKNNSQNIMKAIISTATGPSNTIGTLSCKGIVEF